MLLVCYWGHIPAAEYRKVIVGLSFPSVHILCILIRNIRSWLMKAMDSKMIKMPIQWITSSLFQKMRDGTRLQRQLTRLKLVP